MTFKYDTSIVLSEFYCENTILRMKTSSYVLVIYLFVLLRGVDSHGIGCYDVHGNVIVRMEIYKM